MQILALLTSIREIKHAVVSDAAGTLLESMGESDAETIAAVIGYSVSTLNEVGQTLGLGDFQRLTYGGKVEGCIVTTLESNVVAVFVDPTAPMNPIEKKLDAALGRTPNR